MADQDRTFKLDFGSMGEVTVRINPEAVAGIPNETLVHLREANRQGLLALRSVLDHLIERLETKDGSRPPGPTRIQVEGQEPSPPKT